MKRIFRLTYLNLLILACLISIAALSILFFYQTKQLDKTNQWVAHTQETMINSYNVLSDEQSMRLATQRFIITGDKKYLTSYQQSANAIYNDIAILKKLTIDNKLQQNRLIQLQIFLQKEINIINSAINLRKYHTLDYTLNNLKTYPFTSGYSITQRISTIVRDIINQEKELLKIRSSNSFNHLIAINKIGLFANSISIFIIIICLYFLNKQLIQHFITEKKLEKSEIKFKKLAYTDTTTELNNRASLIDRLNHLMENSKLMSDTLALFYIDLDDFKNINDSFGHAVGDQVLRSAADRIKQIFKENLNIYRISGDEFVVILNITDQNTAILMAQNLLASFAIPLHLNNQQIINTISIGICLFPKFASDADSLLRNADIAMYKAKQFGKNNYQFCDHHMIKEFENKAMLYHQLQSAVMNKEFILMYQPKLSLKTNQLSGLEALIRWKKSDMNLIYPSEFITIAENNGLIIPIGEWVIHSVCSQIKKWQQLGIKISNVAFNVSIKEFSIRDFSSTITKILNEFNLDPGNLEIEITETILMEDSYHNFSSLEYLKSLGLKITIDDFGTGYSSLSYLNSFPIDKLKIDKSFIAQINPQNPEPVIISAIISMAHKLGIQVIAEGVETKMQLDFLKHHQCDEIQGYHFSPPLSDNEIHDFILNHQDVKI